MLVYPREASRTHSRLTEFAGALGPEVIAEGNVINVQ
jgi:hypothetical protein